MKHSNAADHRRILFLCTGNYYRSRFAEILFNARARETGLPWSAFSRALAIELGGCNIGPISQHTRHACRSRGITIPEPIPFPCGAAEDDFHSAHHIVALKEAEHRAYMRRKFPDWADRIEYWHVHDLDQASPADACAQIERHVEELISRLSAAPQATHGSPPSRA